MYCEKTARFFLSLKEIFCTFLINTSYLLDNIKTVCKLLQNLLRLILIYNIKCVNPFDPGGSYCYWDSIKPCKSNEFIFMAYGSVTRG
jgi:hypothetical protein